MNIPAWLHILAILALILAGASALIIVIDILQGNRQHMRIMNVVWPLTALYAGPLALWAYIYRWSAVHSTSHGVGQS